MLYSVLLLQLVLHFLGALAKHDDADKDPFGDILISKLSNDANLDLSVDEEYEDLRAELLAYHTALATLTSNVGNDKDPLQKELKTGRRSMGSTPCWDLGGICINYKLCSGYRFLSEVPGCKDKLRVCCFTWNRYRPRDHSDFGISNLAYPWSHRQEFGGKGVVGRSDEDEDDHTVPPKKKKKMLHDLASDDDRKNNTARAFAIIIRNKDSNNED